MAMQLSNKQKADGGQGVCREGQRGAPRCLPEWGKGNEKSANKAEKTALKGPEKLNRNSEGR